MVDATLASGASPVDLSFGHSGACCSTWADTEASLGTDLHSTNPDCNLASQLVVRL